MAIKASAQITLTGVVDVVATYRYYLLQSSTLDAPAKPAVYPPPDTWTDTEPSYTDGSTNSLYFVDCTVFSDDTFIYSAVSLSSSYEAAKTAYNAAVNAQGSADLANNRVDSVETEQSNTSAKVDSIQQGVDANAADISNVRDYVTNIDLKAEGLAFKINQIAPNGVVTEVVTTTGYEFGADGMHVEKSGEEISNRITHKGMYVDCSDENVLTADANGVEGINIKARKYLIVGKHTRIEDYTDEDGVEGTALFYLP